MTWLPATPAEAIASLRDASCASLPQPPLHPALTPAQSSAVHRVRTALHNYRGALVADPPGSGKSFIALQIALDAHTAGHRVLLTAPAALASTWRRLLQPAGIRFTFLSHTRLSLDDQTVAQTPAPDLILVDEAHAFRNPATRRYHSLARFTRSAPALLLTATPINNSLMDMYFLLRLFLGDHAFAYAGIPSLSIAFHSAASSSEALPPPLQTILGKVVIRRSRKELDQENGARQPPTPPPTLPPNAPAPASASASAAHYPTLRTPSLVRYDLDPASPGFTRFAVECISALRLAAFESAGNDHAPAELLRLTLAKRLESGAAAFAASLRSLVAFHMTFLEALAAGQRLRPRDSRPDADHAMQLSFAPLLGSPITNAATRDRLDADARHDLDILTRLLRRTRSLNRTDPKRTRLLHLLQGPLRGRRTLVFTEFRLTAADLFRALRHIPGTARLDGSGACIASGPCSRHHVITGFAPHANGAPEPPPEHAITTLIATDVLSEGMNLQDADCVISYDVPWNPVRLIQRIGRIDRIGSPHAAVDAFIFMPDLWLDEFTSLVDRVSDKLRQIRRGLAGYPRPADPLEHSADHHSAFLRALAAGIAPADAVASTASSPTPVRSAFATLLEDPRIPLHTTPSARQADTVPVAFLPTSTGFGHATLVVTATSTASDPRFTLVRQDSARPLSTTRAALLLRAALEAPHPADPPRLHARLLRTLENAAATALATTFIHPDTPLTRSASTTGRVIRHVLSIAASFASEHADLAPLADSIVATLAHGLPAGAEHAALDWLRNTPTPTDPASAHLSLTHLGSALSAPVRRPPSLLAVFLLRR